MTVTTSFLTRFASVSVVGGTPQPITDGLSAMARLSNVPLDGSEVYRAFTTITAAATALAASEIDQDTYDAIAAAFGQTPRVQTFYVIAWDVSGGDTAAEGLDAAEAAGLVAPWDFVHLVIDSRTASDIVSAAGWASTRRVFFTAQSSDGDWLTSGVPAGFSTIATNTQTAVLYEDTDTTQADAGWAGRVAGFNPDSQRVSSAIEVFNVLSEYSTPLTATQQGFIGDNNANFHQVITPKGSRRAITSAVSGGGIASPKVLSGATVALRRTVIYLEVRNLQSMGELLTTKLAAGEAIPANAQGRAMIEGAVIEDFENALKAGYLTPRPDLDLPRGYSIETTFTGSGASLTATVTGLIAYNDEVAAIASQFTATS